MACLGVKTSRNVRAHAWLQQQYGWLAGGLLDEALRVFGALQAAAYMDDGRLDDELRRHSG